MCKDSSWKLSLTQFIEVGCIFLLLRVPVNYGIGLDISAHLLIVCVSLSASDGAPNVCVSSLYPAVSFTALTTTGNIEDFMQSSKHVMPAFSILADIRKWATSLILLLMYTCKCLNCGPFDRSQTEHSHNTRKTTPHSNFDTQITSENYQKVGNLLLMYTCKWSCWPYLSCKTAPNFNITESLFTTWTIASGFMNHGEMQHTSTRVCLRKLGHASVVFRVTQKMYWQLAMQTSGRNVFAACCEHADGRQRNVVRFSTV